jgi:hypothetical protein
MLLGIEFHDYIQLGIMLETILLFFYKYSFPIDVVILINHLKNFFLQKIK